MDMIRDIIKTVGGKKLVSLGMTKFSVLGGKATVLGYMYDEIPI